MARYVSLATVGVDMDDAGLTVEAPGVMSSADPHEATAGARTRR